MSEVAYPVREALAETAQLAPPDPAADARAGFQFRRFQVRVGNRVLLRDGEPVELGSRAFDLLVVLLRARGAVVSKRQLLQDVWPSTIVDESNLRFQMACLRRALGPDRDLIKTVQGRGYLFISEVVSVWRPEAPTKAAPHLSSAPQGFLSDEGPATVAVVEDDENTREALDGLLRSWGFRVETYPAVQALTESGRAGRADCLVLDVWLPGQSGLDFQAELKAAGIAVPIVFISGHADVHMSVRAMKAGAVEFLTKPVRHQDLLEAIESAVAVRRRRDFSR